MFIVHFRTCRTHFCRKTATLVLISDWLYLLKSYCYYTNLTWQNCYYKENWKVWKSKMGNENVLLMEDRQGSRCPPCGALKLSANTERYDSRRRIMIIFSMLCAWGGTLRTFRAGLKTGSEWRKSEWGEIGTMEGSNSKGYINRPLKSLQGCSWREPLGMAAIVQNRNIMPE